MKVGLVCSAGGHLAQLHRLSPWWGAEDRFWVTFDKPDARARLAAERVYFAHGPTNRSVANLARNLALARAIVDRERPDVIVSNGAGVALPFFLAGKAAGVKLVYFEVIDRIDAPSLTGRLLYPIADRMVVQWEAQRAFYPDAVLVPGATPDPLAAHGGGAT